MSGVGGPPLLRAEGLSAGYGDRIVLRGLHVELAAGELVCVLGPNGAGKSTLLRTLAGMQPLLAGRVELSGRDLGSFSPRQLARRVGVVLPERIHPGMLSAYNLVALGRYPHTGWTGRLRPRDSSAIDEALAAVRVAHLAHRRVTSLSDGERQKVMIARALAQEPTMLILDEPTAYLDLPGRVEVMGLLGGLAHRGGPALGSDRPGRAVLLSTHDLDLALRTADRVWLVDREGTLACGAPEDLVLTGAYEAAFATDAAKYDPESGSFRLVAPAGMAVTLAGVGLAAHWTRRALRRRGFGVGDRVAGDAGSPGAPAVAVEERRGRPVWRSTVRGATLEHGSIEELLKHLPDPAGPLDGLPDSGENGRFETS